MRICILYAGNSKVVKCAGISMISLFENNKEIDEIVVYFIEDRITDEEKKKLQEIASIYLRKLLFCSISQMIPEGIKTYDSRFPQSSFVRLFAERINEDRILYLDCDTLIVSSIKELWRVDLGEHWFGAVQDIVAPIPRMRTGLKYEDRYINAGVLLINNTILRRDKFAEKAINYMENYYNENHTMVIHNDQGIINAVSVEKIKYLKPIYNVISPIFLYQQSEIKELFDIPIYYTLAEIEEAKMYPAIIHFVEGNFGRPWMKGCKHPKRYIYYKYMDMSPWKRNFEKNTLLFRRRLDRYLYKFLPFSLYAKLKISYRIKKK